MIMREQDFEWCFVHCWVCPGNLLSVVPAIFSPDVRSERRCDNKINTAKASHKQSADGIVKAERVHAQCRDSSTAISFIREGEPRDSSQLDLRFVRRKPLIHGLFEQCDQFSYFQIPGRPYLTAI